MDKKKKRWVIGAIILLCIVFAVFLQPSRPAKKTISTDNGYVAVIRVEGPIVGAADIPSNLFSGGTTASSGRLMKEIRQAAADPAAKAVLLRINSPGGSATASQEIGDEIDRLKASGKPVVVSMGDMCASGGYWLAAKGDRVFANPSSMTGSIGVYIGYTNYEELMGKLGINNDKIKSGAHKDILSPDRPMTPEERALVQGMVDDIYEQFVDVVATGRQMDPQQVRELADGRIFTGRQAQAAGLVDAMGNYYDALDYTANLVGLPTTDVPTREYGDDSVSWQRLFGAELRGAFRESIGSLARREGLNARTEWEAPHAQ